jgi:cystathionine gamma-synthase
MLPDDARFDTRAIHAGQEFDPTTGAVIPPVYLTSTYVQDGIGGLRNGYEYSRGGNPTRTGLEIQLAALEGGIRGLSFASGLAAEDALLRTVLAPGDHVVIGNDVYGGTHRLVRRIFGAWGIRHTTVDTSDLDAVRDAIELGTTKVLWVETPSNPLMKISDVAALAEVGDEAGVLVVVDNTFASPALQRPLSLGADIVFHSATKYLAGHSDTVLGVAVTRNPEVAERLRFLQNAAGAVPGPFDCFLALRGLRTLALRVGRHNLNASEVARFLAEREDVDWLSYPGLGSGRHAHPQAACAARQMRSGGGMVSFVPAARDGRAARERAIAICEATRIFTLAESLGGVESLIELPAVMTHASVAGSRLEVPEALIRLSVGIESAADLIGDLAQAMDRS